MTAHDLIRQKLRRVRLELADGPGPRRSWVQVLPAGTFTYRGKEVEVTAAQLAEIARETMRAYRNFDAYALANGSTPYRFPIIREHTRNGEKDGTIDAVKVAPNKAGTPALWLCIDWTPRAWKQIDDGEIEWMSVAISSGYEDLEGEVYSLCVTECSLTVGPVRKDIPTIQDTLHLTLSERVRALADTYGEDPMEELMQQLIELLTNMDGKLDQILANPADDPEMEAADDETAEDVELSDDDGDDQEEDDDPSALVLSQLVEAVQTLNERLTPKPGNLNLSEPKGGAKKPAGKRRKRTTEQWLELGKKKGLEDAALWTWVMKQQNT